MFPAKGSKVLLSFMVMSRNSTSEVTKRRINPERFFAFLILYRDNSKLG